MSAELEKHIRDRDYRAALQISQRLYDPAHPQAAISAMHGHVLQQLGQHQEARSVLEQARTLQPNLPSIWIDLANACIADGDWKAAAIAVARFRTLAPQSGAGLFAEAEVRLGLGQHAEADVLFQQAAGVHPNFLNRRLRLAGRAADECRYALADWHYQCCLQAYPEVSAVGVDFLASLFHQRKYAQAAALAKQSLLRWPDDTRLLGRYSTLLDFIEPDFDEQLRVRRHWLSIAPDSAEAHVALANVHATLSDFEQAHPHWRRAQELDPAQLIARWTALHFPDRYVADSEAQAQQFQQRWDRELAFFASVPLLAAATCLRLIQSCPSKFLVYAATDIRDSLQRRAGVLSRFVDQVLIETAPRAVASAAQRRRRIGIVSPSFGWHSVSRVWRELILAVGREQLELVCFNVECPDDDSVARWRSGADVFVDHQGGLLEWHRCLSAADLDVLIFLDLGPDATCQALATRRYAPVQCTTWAFPITSGSATIDYFLSSDLMEPAQAQAQAQAHYTETLVRLPGLACAFRPEIHRAAQKSTVTDGGAAATRYLCAQTASKLLPVHDPLFAKILSADAGSSLAISHGGRANVSAALRQRMAPVLDAHGIDAEQRLQVHAHMAFADYGALLAGTDVFLDTLQFSGCLTSLDALSLGIPTVTLPGATLCGRQTAAMLRVLELPELIANDVDDYVRIATTLGRDADYRQSISARIEDRRHRLYEFADSAKALEAFLIDVQ